MPLYRPPLIAPSHHLSCLLFPQKWPQYYTVALDGDSGQGQGQGQGPGQKQGPRGGKAAARSRRRAAATAEEEEDDGAHADL